MRKHFSPPLKKGEIYKVLPFFKWELEGILVVIITLPDSHAEAVGTHMVCIPTLEHGNEKCHQPAFELSALRSSGLSGLRKIVKS